MMMDWLSTTRGAAQRSPKKPFRPESAIKLLGYLLGMAAISAVIAMFGVQLIATYAFG